jgi:outer membrane usher protein FimD/PapC
VVEQEDGKTQAPVGREGQAYLDNLAEQNRLTVRLPSGKTCVADFPFLMQEGNQVRVFQAVCTEAL